MDMKKIVALGLSGLIVGAGVTAGLLNASYSASIEVANEQIATLNGLTFDQSVAIDQLNSELNIKNDLISELENVEPTVITETVEVEKEVEVLVDNGNLNMVLDFMYNTDDISFITEDLFDDELDSIIDRIILINDVKSASENYVLSNFARELEKFDSDYDRRDISRVKIDKDSVEFINSAADFKYEKFVVKMDVEFRYDGSSKTKSVEVGYYNGKVRNINFIQF